MSSPTSGGLFYAAQTGVFWDLDDCPIPDHLTPASVSANIRSSLANAGYVGDVSIAAYSLTKQNAVDFESAGVKFVQPGGSNEKYHTIHNDVFNWAMDHLYGRSNLMIIAKDVVEDHDYAEVLMLIRKQHNNIILALPCDPSDLLRSTASSLWLWAELSTGGQSGSVQVVTPSPTSSSSSSPRTGTRKKQMKDGLKPCQEKRKTTCTRTRKKQMKDGLKPCQEKRKTTSTNKFEN